jgi:Zn-dependent protease
MSVIIIGIAFAGSPTILYFLVIIVLRPAVILNGMLGLFNMIPIQPFDGGTIFQWDKRVWGIVSLGLVALLIMGYVVIGLLF